MAKDKKTALLKRQKIDSSKKMMFVSVAIVAVLSGALAVVSYMLIQQISFHSHIISLKGKTLKTIKKNITEVDKLKDNIRTLDNNKDLESMRINKKNSPLQVVLDALPAEPNPDALGASLQFKFVAPIQGLTIDSLLVDSSGGDSKSMSSIELTGENGIGFRMVVSGDASSLRTLLSHLESSIRLIKLNSVEIQAGSKNLSMTIVGEAYYEPARVIEIGNKVERPN